MAGLGALGVLFALAVMVALAVLAVLLPYFVWRTKVYVKLCYEELRTIRERDAPQVAVSEEERAALNS